MVSNQYEELRKKNLEENNKKIAQLRKLALSLKKTAPPKPSPARKVRSKPVDVALTPIRRSSRTADKPAPNYKEFAVELLGESRRSYKRRDLSNRVYASDERRKYAKDRADKLESFLGTEFPTSLPLSFCKEELPLTDEYIYLVNELGEEWEVKYLIGKNGLSGGWRGFAIDNQLVDGDALVFQRIKPIVFKVYIIRVNTIEEEEEEEGHLENREEEGRHEDQETADVAKVKGKKASRRNQSRCNVGSRPLSTSKSLSFPVC